MYEPASENVSRYIICRFSSESISLLLPRCYAIPSEEEMVARPLLGVFAWKQHRGHRYLSKPISYSKLRCRLHVSQSKLRCLLDVSWSKLRFVLHVSQSKLRFVLHVSQSKPRIVSATRLRV